MSNGTSDVKPQTEYRYVLAGFFLFVIICVAWHFYRKSELATNGVILSATISANLVATKSSVMLFEYRFTYGGKSYVHTSPAGVTNARTFIGRSFPLRFSPQSGRSELLVTPRHFSRYDLPYPDSLHWVKSYAISGS
jgi:hypothetical protein